MGIDNNGMLVVGLESSEFPYDKLEGYADEGLGEWAYLREGMVVPMGMEIQEVRNDYWKEGIAGIVVADSGSYSYKEAVDIEIKIQAAREAFMALFGADPRVFILNWQW